RIPTAAAREVRAEPVVFRIESQRNQSTRIEQRASSRDPAVKRRAGHLQVHVVAAAVRWPAIAHAAWASPQVKHRVGTGTIQTHEQLCTASDDVGRARRNRLRAGQAARGIVHGSFDPPPMQKPRSEEHTSELQSPYDLVCRLLLEKKKKN